MCAEGLVFVNPGLLGFRAVASVTGSQLEESVLDHSRPIFRVPTASASPLKLIAEAGSDWRRAAARQPNHAATVGWSLLAFFETLCTPQEWRGCPRRRIPAAWCGRRRLV